MLPFFFNYWKNCKKLQIYIISFLEKTIWDKNLREDFLKCLYISYTLNKKANRYFHYYQIYSISSNSIHISKSSRSGNKHLPTRNDGALFLVSLDTFFRDYRQSLCLYWIYSLFGLMGRSTTILFLEYLSHVYMFSFRY